MRMRVLFTMVGLLGLAALSAQAYRLQFKDPQDAMRTLKGTMHMKGTMDMTMNMTTVEKVLAANADGTATISYAIKDGKVVITMTAPGETTPKTIEQPFPTFGMSFKRTAVGKISDLKMTGDIDPKLKQQLDTISSQLQYPGQGMVFPDKELNIGDSWDGTQSFALLPGSKMDLKVKYTLTGTKEVNGKTYLVLTSDIDAKAKDLAMKVPGEAGAADTKLKMTMNIIGTGTTLYDVNAGEMGDVTFKMNTDMSVVSEGSDGMSMKMKMIMDGQMVRQ